jgi:Aspartyl protease/PDZ domain
MGGKNGLLHRLQVKEAAMGKYGSMAWLASNRKEPRGDHFWADGVAGRLCCSLYILLFVTALLRASMAMAASDPKADALIAAAKAASGGSAWDGIGILRQSGTLSAGGLSGRFERWIDPGGPRFARTFELGPASGGEGWDGRRAWSVDSSGDVRIETSAESTSAAIDDAYRTSFAFFLPGRFRIGRAYAGKRNVEGVSYDVVTVSPTVAQSFEIWFDPITHLITREVEKGGAEARMWLFSDWRAAGPVFLPYRVVERTGSDPRFDQVEESERIESPSPAPARRFDPPPPSVRQAEWPNGATQVVMPFRLVNNHIYVPASLDGLATVPFIFDTGATDIIDTAHASALGFATAGALPVGGFGDTLSAFGFAKVRSISIGGLTLRDQVFGALDLTWLRSIEGADAAGLFGYEFARRAVVKIDYGQRRLTFTRPNRFVPPAAASVPFKFHEHAVLVEASLDGVTGEFEIDTGSRSALTLNGPFAATHKLVEKYRPGAPVIVNFGVGGPARARLARAGILKVGPIMLRSPIVQFASGTGGDGAARHVAGNIGGDLLKRFTLTLDYTKQRLWLEPNALAHELEPFDRSGLWVSLGPGGEIVVGDVAPGSAGAMAAIASGDAIVSIGGKPARDITLADIREMFMAPAGTRLELTVRHGGAQRHASLVLADRV